MKKIIVILVICLFLISLVPIGFADKNSEKDRKGMMDENIKKEMEIERERMMKENPEGLSEFGKFNKNLAMKFKESDLSRKEIAKELFKERKEKFDELKKKFFSDRDEFKDAKTKLKGCKKKDSEECKIIKAEFKGKTKVFFGNSASAMINMLENVNARLETLNLENKDELIAENIEVINELKEIKLKIEAMSETATDAELKDATKKLRETWKKAKKSHSLSNGFLLSDRMGGILNKAEHLKTKMDKILARLEAKNVDVSAAEEQIKSFNNNIALAIEKHSQAILIFNDAKGSEKFSDKIKEGQVLLKEARNFLKEAHQDMKEVVKSVKKTKEGENELEEKTEEVDSENNEEQASSEEITEVKENTEANVPVETNAEVSATDEVNVNTGINTEVSAEVNI